MTIFAQSYADRIEMMTKPFQKRTWLLLAAKAAGITGIAFLLSFIISSPFAATNADLISSTEKSEFVR